MGPKNALVLLLTVITCFLHGCAFEKPNASAAQTFTISLQTESRRVVDLRVSLPTSCDYCNTIIFSHGHSLSYDQYDALLSRWAMAGYLTLAPLHVDSEFHKDRDEFLAGEYLGLRVQDLGMVAAWLTDGTAAASLDLKLSERFVLAGHSFGALIAQMGGGATVIRNEETIKLDLQHPPIAVVAISPPGPVAGYLSAAGWNRIHVPHLVVTGTEDVVPLFAPTWQSHLASFRAGPVGMSYALTFTGMDHYFNGAFGRLRVIDADSENAIDTLNRAILQFAGTHSEGRSLSDVAWSKFAAEKVHAESR